MPLNSDRIVPKNLREPFYLEHIQRYEFAIPYCKGKKTLDLGCGVGYGSYFLSKNGAKSISAVDLDQNAIRYARNNYSAPIIKYKVSDASALPYRDDSFDTIVSFEVIEHIKMYDKYLEEVKRVLKKNGTFILSTPNLLGHRNKSSAYHFTEFSPTELEKVLTKFGFKIKIYGQYFKNRAYLKSETEYFNRYKQFTLQGNPYIKKLYNLIPSRIKSSIYKLIWNPLPQPQNDIVVIDRKNTNNSTTLIAVCTLI